MDYVKEFSRQHPAITISFIVFFASITGFLHDFTLLLFFDVNILDYVELSDLIISFIKFSTSMFTWGVIIIYVIIGYISYYSGVYNGRKNYKRHSLPSKCIESLSIEEIEKRIKENKKKIKENEKSISKDNVKIFVLSFITILIIQPALSGSLLAEKIYEGKGEEIYLYVNNLSLPLQNKENISLSLITTTEKYFFLYDKKTKLVSIIQRDSIKAVAKESNLK